MDYVLFLSCVFHAFRRGSSVHCCLVVTCWEGLSSWLSFVMSNCEVVTKFPIGIMGQVWCLIVSIPDICHLSYFETYRIVEQRKCRRAGANAQTRLKFRCSHTQGIRRPPDKSVYLKTIFFISHPEQMLWVVKRTVSMKQLV